MSVNARFVEMREEFGLETVQQVIVAPADYCERRMQAEIRAIPDGTYCFSDPMSARSADWKFTHRWGTVVNAEFPAPTGQGNSITCQRIVDVLLGALAQALPDRVCAACTGSMNGIHIGGFDRTEQRYFSHIETYGGGYGGSAQGDGESGVHTHMTNTRNAPVEVIEAVLPVTVESYTLVPDSEGPGQHRGGFGIRRIFRIGADQLHGTTSTDRKIAGPWGLAGGDAAPGPQHRLIRANGEEIELPAKAAFELNSGDLFIVETSGGGGWGDVRNRDPATIAEDVEEGLISPQRAAAVYGVG